MDKDLENLKIVYGTQLKELKAGNMSPAQVKATQHVIEALEEAETVKEWRERMENENHWLEMGKAMASDQYRVKAKAFKETYYPMLEKPALELAEKILEIDNEEELNEFVLKKSDELFEMEVAEDRRRKDFIHSFELIFKYSITPLDFAGEQKEQVGWFRGIIDEKLGGLDNFIELSKDPLYREALCYKAEVIDEMVEIGKEMYVVEIDDEVTDKDAKWMADFAEKLYDDKDALIEKAIERQKGVHYRVFVGEVTGDEPNGYNIEQVWHLPEGSKVEDLEVWDKEDQRKVTDKMKTELNENQALLRQLGFNI